MLSQTFCDSLICHLHEASTHYPARGEDEDTDSHLAFRHVLSLTECSDELNLWRFYGDDGRGYALRINIEKLKK